MTVVGWIVGILVIVSFFHIGYIVNKLRDESRKQTKLLSLLAIYTGQGRTINQPGLSQGEGKVLFMGSIWDCTRIQYISYGTAVRVVSAENLFLHITEAKEAPKS